MAIRIIECHGRGETKTIAPKLFEQLTKLITARSLDDELSKFARELGEKRIDVELAAAAEQYAQSISGGPVSLGGLYVALQRVGHRLQQPFLREGISRLLEFCLRQTGTRFMDRFGLVLSVKRQLENMPLEVHKKSPLLQILSEDQRKDLLSKKLKLPLSEDLPLWGIVSKIAYWLKHPAPLSRPLCLTATKPARKSGVACQGMKVADFHPATFRGVKRAVLHYLTLTF